MSYFLKTNYEEPLLFRSCDKVVHAAAINEGSIWLRSIHYYRGIEDDIARHDGSEGVNFTPHTFPLRFDDRLTNLSSISGDGSIGCEIVPCYILSMHGTGIREDVRKSFGDYMFGVRSIYKFSNDVLYQSQQQINVTGHRYGQVSYQYTPLCISQRPNSVAIALAENMYLKSQTTDILRKAPVSPFIFQDEWRIAIFVNRYLNDDPDEILKINVTQDNFYDYTVF
jgi:hypothetical protein